MIRFYSFLLLSCYGELTVSYITKTLQGYGSFVDTTVSSCHKQLYAGPRGIISSPGYPNGYPNFTSCTWIIIVKHFQRVLISFSDFDVEGEVGSCDGQDCCIGSWLNVYTTQSESAQLKKQYCGRNSLPPVYESFGHDVIIKFHSVARVQNSRGFIFSYMISHGGDYKCKPDEFQCHNKRCILKRWVCNGQSECEDYSDEKDCQRPCFGDSHSCGPHSNDCFLYQSEKCNKVIDCVSGLDEMGCDGCAPNKLSCANSEGCYYLQQRCDSIPDCLDFSDELGCGLCPENETRCSVESTECFNPQTQRCNNVLECTSGSDERDCVDKCVNSIACQSGVDCYTEHQRCDGIPNCSDGSDEELCNYQLCNQGRGGYLCDNMRCIRSEWRCDQTNDCEDGSDERNCIQNSVIVASVLGSLICGLLLVIAIGCTIKLYALKYRLDNEDNHTLRPYFNFSLPRDPPPPYTLAVNDPPPFTRDTLLQGHTTFVNQLSRVGRRPDVSLPDREGTVSHDLGGSSDSLDKSSNKSDTCDAASRTSEETVSTWPFSGDPQEELEYQSDDSDVVMLQG